MKREGNESNRSTYESSQTIDTPSRILNENNIAQDEFAIKTDLFLSPSSTRSSEVSLLVTPDISIRRRKLRFRNAKNNATITDMKNIETSKDGKSFLGRISMKKEFEKLSDAVGPNCPLNRMPLTTAWISKNEGIQNAEEDTNKSFEKDDNKTIKVQSASPSKSQTINHHGNGNLQLISMDEYISAPHFVQTSVSLQDVNLGVNTINCWLESNIQRHRSQIKVSEQNAYEIMENCFDKKKNKAIFMSLCFWKKISIQMIDGEKLFVFNV